jgi:anti-anti-sigma factor
MKMGIQDLTENILLVDAPPEPGLNEELKNVAEVVRERGDCDVVIDFSHVDIVTSSSLSKLLKLRKLLMDCDHRLVLCCVASATKGIFSITALDGVFEMVHAQPDAIESLKTQPAGQQL